MLKKKLLKIMTIGLVSTSIFTINTIGASAQWKQDSKGWWYEKIDSSCCKNEWLNYGGKWYYFDDNEYMVTGWKQIDNKWYYFYPDGYMAVNTTIDGYYLDKNGVWNNNANNTKTSTSNNSVKPTKSKVDATNDMNWFEENGNKYFKVSDIDYLDGQKYGEPCLRNGQWEIDGEIYSFDENGVMQTGVVNIYGINYLFDNNGKFIGGADDERATLFVSSAITTGNSSNRKVKLEKDFKNMYDWCKIQGDTVTLTSAIKNISGITGSVKVINAENESVKNNIFASIKCDNPDIAFIGISSNNNNELQITVLPKKSGKTNVELNVNGTVTSFELVINAY